MIACCELRIYRPSHRIAGPAGRQLVVIHKTGQLKRHITGDALARAQDGTQGVPWTSEKGSRDGDVGEKARLNHAVVRTLCAYSYLRDSQQQQKRLTYVIFRCSPTSTDGVSGRREMTELRKALKHEPSVAGCLAIRVILGGP